MTGSHPHDANSPARQPAQQPEDLSRHFVERANDGDLDGVVALYEPDAVMALPSGDLAEGNRSIREALAQLLATQPTFDIDTVRSAVRNGDLALTWSQLQTGATAEIARRQDDGTWLWIIDQPYIRAGATSDRPPGANSG